LFFVIFFVDVFRTFCLLVYSSLLKQLIEWEKKKKTIVQVKKNRRRFKRLLSFVHSNLNLIE